MKKYILLSGLAILSTIGVSACSPRENAKIAELKKDYPLTTCPVSGAKLGEMGKPVDYLHGTKLVRFCCSGCIQTFNESPDKYLSLTVN